MGLSDDYLDYDVITTTNSANSVRNDGVEWSWRQSLKPFAALPRWTRGFQVWVNGTHLRLSGSGVDEFSGYSPRIINWGASYASARFLVRYNVARIGRQRVALTNVSATVPPCHHAYDLWTRRESFPARRSGNGPRLSGGRAGRRLLMKRYSSMVAGRWLAASVVAIVTHAVTSAATPPILDYTIKLEVIREGYDGVHCWVHPRAGIVPGVGGAATSVVLTLQQLWLKGSDVFGPLHELRSDDLGRTWSALREHKETLGPRPEPDEVTVAVCDFWPKWHAASGKLLGIGHTVRYKDNAVMRERTRETYFSVYDPTARTWTPWKTLAMPAEARFYNAGAGCVQRVDLPNGEILLPFYYKAKGESDYRTAVARCAFDGAALTVKEIGREVGVPGGRGVYEPSLARSGGRFFLTLRNDDTAYVAVSRDGLNFDAPKRWTWDDGSDLGSYNTQAHWVTHRDALYLVYTRRGAGNDHVFRHRAPLFMAQVDPERCVVLRSTERILVPEHGARLGNFGVTEVSENEVWVTVAEWMQGPAPLRVIPPGNPWGANNRVYAARIRFDQRPPATDASRKTARDRPRRLLFNDDGGETRVPARPLTNPTDFLPLRIAPLAGTHVETLMFDTSSGTFGRVAHRTAMAEPFLVREGRFQHNILSKSR